MGDVPSEGRARLCDRRGPSHTREITTTREGILT